MPDPRQGPQTQTQLLPLELRLPSGGGPAPSAPRAVETKPCPQVPRGSQPQSSLPGPRPLCTAQAQPPFPCWDEAHCPTHALPANNQGTGEPQGTLPSTPRRTTILSPRGARPSPTRTCQGLPSTLLPSSSPLAQPLRPRRLLLSGRGITGQRPPPEPASDCPSPLPLCPPLSPDRLLVLLIHFLDEGPLHAGM